MIATPAVDLRGGRCVQLVGGRPEDERVSLPDPVSVARSWWERGFAALHVVDLDAALGEGDNRAVIEAVASATPAETQVGGGIRDEDAVAAVLQLGVSRAVVGTRAVDDRDWLETQAARFPGRITVAADIRDGVILRKGWTEGTGLEVNAFLETLENIPLAGVLCTDVGREGLLQGIDRAGVKAALDASPHPVWISGGVTTMDEVDFLAEHGAAGVVLGMALYTNTLDADEVAARYGGAATSEAAPLPAPNADNEPSPGRDG